METAASNTSSSKLKYIIIFLFIAALGFTVFKMMQFEDSIREQRIIRINVGGEKKKLLPEISPADLQSKSDKSRYRFKTGEKYFSVLETKIKNGENVQEWNRYFLKGVNMGVALPGHYPSEFSATYENYFEWFEKIAEMNSNTIRIYTILPPEFYEAFAQYNINHSNKPLYLLQGVWAEETDSNNYFDKNYIDKFQTEIKDVIDVIHGQAVIQERPGHAAGTYARDVSSFVIGILLGREWEPVTVSTTNKKNAGIKKYNGNFISLPAGNPMEAWLAQMMDFTVQYETQIYEEQRPVSFVNWLPLDPMYHNSEFIESKKVREYDNDLESVDFEKFYATNLFKAGIFAAYHAYPYYPDFVYLDDKYKDAITKEGQHDNYFACIDDLKKHCRDMPLIIAEYGLPSSRGNSHYTNFGLDQGGHSEADQSDKNKILTKDIYEAGCGGAIYFEWMDEWFKFNWLVLDFEVPASRRKFWHNMENPEQNFGVLAVEQRKRTIDGLDNDWNEKDKLDGNTSGDVSAHADAEYFYLKYKLNDFDFGKNNLYVAIDTYDKKKGSHRLPFLKENQDNGYEFLMTFNNKDSAAILVDEKYSVYSDIYNDYVPLYCSKENYDGNFVRQIMLSNRERESLTGEKTPRRVYDRSGLIYGKSNEYETSNSNWIWNENEKILEIRLPWHLLNVSDPSSGNVLDDKPGTGEIESTVTDGFNIGTFITDKSDHGAKEFPSDKLEFFKWKHWDQPEYITRLKKTYYMFKDLYPQLQPKAEDSAKSELSPKFEIAEWKENRIGAITISLDDGSMSQYVYGVPVLNKYNVKSTFALTTNWMAENPSSSAEKGNFAIEKFGWKQARELVSQGDEIASHNIYHIKMDTMSNESALYQMTESRKMIEQQISSPVYTFVFPYSSSRSNQFDMTKQAGFIFARTGEETVNDAENINLNKLSTIAIYNEDSPSTSELSRMITDAAGKWIIINYHTIFPQESKEMNLMKYHNVTSTYSVTPEMFDRQVRLIRNSGYWIAPISEIGKYIVERKNTTLEVIVHGDKIYLNAVNSLNSSVYNIPLTVSFTTNWRIVKVTNSAADGIFNPRDNRISLSLIPNKEVLIENISE